MLRGKIAKKAKRGQKRAITQLRKKTTSNLPTKESNTRKKKTYITHPSKPSMKRNQQHIKHTIISNAGAYTAHTHTETRQNKTKTKHQNKPSSKNKKALHIYIIGKKICCPSVAF